MPWTEAQIDAAAEALRKAWDDSDREEWSDLARAVLATVEPQRTPVDSWVADVERRLRKLEGFPT